MQKFQFNLFNSNRFVGNISKVQSYKTSARLEVVQVRNEFLYSFVKSMLDCLLRERLSKCARNRASERDKDREREREGGRE